MLKKTLILGIILISLLVFSTLSATAVEETKTIEDNEDDVLKAEGFDLETGTTVSYKPNVDIKKIIYEQKDQIATVTLTVKGKIENRGNIEDLLGDPDEDSDPDDFSLDFVMYTLSIETSSTLYEIQYVNMVCDMANSGGDMEPTSCSDDGSNLVVSFDLQDDDETLVSVSAATMDMKILAFVGNTYMDVAPDPEDLEVTASGPSKGKVNETISFSGEVDGGSPGYEWEWNFGDGTGVSYLKNPTHKYDESGTYEVTLYVSDEDLNSGSDSFKITISDNNNDKSNNDDDDIRDDVSSAASPLFVFIGLIAIIAVIGIAVLIHIIKK